ncbi:hypothetical protein HPG69_016437, partial [Diceros bicornis minor]
MQYTWVFLLDLISPLSSCHLRNHNIRARGHQLGAVYAAYHLSYCKSNVVNSFSCDRGQVLKLSCNNTRFMEFILFLMASFVLF